MSLETLSINTIRTLAMDAVQKANSGHPGAPMGMAPMAYTLWTQFLRHNPKNPKWLGRDRFILSAGHASMLIYSLLNLTGYDLSLDDIKNFRQLHSKTPGHPEYGYTAGVEMSTGPLGQGFATGVGFALAEAHLAAVYNKPGFELFSNYTYGIVSDGDLMEGISHEAAGLAGNLGLGKMIYLYDDNGISIEGHTDIAFTDDSVKRFEAYGWHVQKVADGNDTAAIAEAIKAAQAVTDKPSIIAVRTVIGYGSPNKADSHDAHGSPLGADEIKLTKANLGWEFEEAFYVPEEVKTHMDATEAGAKLESDWNDLFARYSEQYPQEAAELKLILEGKLPDNIEELLPTFDKPVATRAASGQALNAIAKVFPGLIGGSADLAPSNNTELKGVNWIKKGDYAGRNIHFGVREHGMSAALNGITLYGLRAYGGTFLIFSDYLKPGLRLAALMGIGSIFVLTHDSIGLGEDGPTHQPIEQLAALRATPNVLVFRPADANETAASWLIALENKTRPSALALTRQNLPVLPRNIEGVRKGAYPVKDVENPDIILIASGSEVALALQSATALEAEGIKAKVVSVPSMELFREQDASYKNSVLNPGVKRVAIEAASPLGWHEFVGLDGAIIAMPGFGASGPADLLFKEFGFTTENVVKTVKGLLPVKA
ncbi:transketolase [Deinococcus roseus]|uniref:Transketolase n=1 Tax=Deinococcus roseus TaxID=392414 RepID=A0ABQ2D548_9DEIO|nr:transketolase [Deinococcus roseus]GGJ46378.1 transketolase [Deinococcus roseus]